MGFPKLECLKGCRLAAVKYHHGMYPQSVNLVVDESMCLIVEGMEDRAEMVMMDRARVESELEKDRREEERREREAVERRRGWRGGGGEEQVREGGLE